MPPRAYNLIFNEWFRDENLVPSLSVNTGDGPDSDANYAILNRGKRHDYFTSCLPWPQKGPSVALPLGTSADVKWRNAPGNTPTMRYTAGGLAPAGALSALAGGGIQSAGAPGAAIGLDPSGTLYADLSTATAATINAIRTAFQVQKLLERDARGGTRYTEIIRSHFGVVSQSRYEILEVLVFLSILRLSRKLLLLLSAVLLHPRVIFLLLVLSFLSLVLHNHLLSMALS